MKKILFGIFAHPDDEAFGPAGTILDEVHRGTELHLICLTGGENGENPDNAIDLKETRLKEWRAAGALLGASSMHHLGFIDGTLNNQDQLKAAGMIERIILDTIDTRDAVVECMSMDLNGVTGHIDHIVASRMTCLVYERLKRQGVPINTVRLACVTNEQVPVASIDFVFMEQGREQEMINETVDARKYQDEIRAIIACHHSQRKDGINLIETRGATLGIDTFTMYQ